MMVHQLTRLYTEARRLCVSSPGPPLMLLGRGSPGRAILRALCLLTHTQGLHMWETHREVPIWFSHWEVPGPETPSPGGQ